jgi:hypothetical protein
VPVSLSNHNIFYLLRNKSQNVLQHAARLFSVMLAKASEEKMKEESFYRTTILNTVVDIIT